MPRAKWQTRPALYQTPAVYHVLQPNVATVPKSKPRNKYIKRSITEYNITDAALEHRHFMLSADEIGLATWETTDGRIGVIPPVELQAGLKSRRPFHLTKSRPIYDYKVNCYCTVPVNENYNQLPVERVDLRSTSTNEKAVSSQ